MMHGDGIPLLFEYTDDRSHFCFVGMKADIAQSNQFSGLIEKNTWYDLETPYGYGGPLTDGVIGEDSQKKFSEELREYCLSEGIVSLFVRFHPFLENQAAMPLVFETRYMRDTIYIDTESPETIMNNLDAKNRNVIRKAVRCGVSVDRRPVSSYEEFLSMYEETMLKDQAEPYYWFHADYFESQKELAENAAYFYAMLNDKPIAGTLIYFNDRFAHYHLAGMHTDFKAYAPGNLLLYHVACWASELGIRRFHLGGGMSPEDTLFAFKKKFNKNGRLPFHIGRVITDQKKYDRLIQIRKQNNAEFNMDNTRMIQYRAE